MNNFGGCTDFRTIFGVDTGFIGLTSSSATSALLYIYVLLLKFFQMQTGKQAEIGSPTQKSSVVLLPTESITQISG